MLEPVPQTTPFTLRGLWNLPGSEAKAAGELVYDEDSLRLILIGGLNSASCETPLSAALSQTTFSVVHGTLVDRTPVTLLQCFYTSYRPNVNWSDFSPTKEVPLLESELNCGFAILGDHLETENDEFVAGQVEIPQLEEWLGKSPFTVDFDKNRNVDIQFRPPADEHFQTASFELCLKHAIRPPSYPLSSSPSAEHTSFFVITPSDSSTIKWFATINGELSTLISYLYGGNILSKQLLLKPSGSDKYLPVYYARHRTDSKPIEAHNFWTTYEKIKSDFASILNAWFDASHNHRQARNMLLSSERRPSAFSELRFLPLVHALEVLTQSNESTEIVTKEEFRRIKSLVRDAIPVGTSQELVEAFMRSLGYANGKSLKFKIEQLIATLAPNIIPCLCSDIVAFTKGVVNTRNFYTHYSVQRKILDGRELHWATRKLSVLLRTLLLRSVGVSDELILSILQTNMKIVNERRTWLEVSEIGTAEGTIRVEE